MDQEQQADLGCVSSEDLLQHLMSAKECSQESPTTPESNSWVGAGSTLVTGMKDMVVSGVSMVASGASTLVQRQDGAILQHAKKGDIEALGAVLEAGTSVEYADDKGRTPIMYAASCGQLVMFNHLVGLEANVDAVDNQGNTCLHHLALIPQSNASQQHIIQTLLKQTLASDKTRLFSINSDGLSPLNCAVYSGNLDFLHSYAELINIQQACDSHNISPVELAVSHKKHAVLALFIQHQCDLTKRFKSSLLTKVREGDSKTRQMLLKAGVPRIKPTPKDTTWQDIQQRHHQHRHPRQAGYTPMRDEGYQQLSRQLEQLGQHMVQGFNTIDRRLTQLEKRVNQNSQAIKTIQRNRFKPDAGF